MDSASLHKLLRSTYDKMMPLCAQMMGIAEGVAGLGALFYIVLRVWTSIARTETIDVSPLLHPSVLGFCIMFSPIAVLGMMNAVLSPVVQGTGMMVHQQEGNPIESTTKRGKLQEEAYLRNPETVYLVSNERFDQKIEETGTIGSEDVVTITGMYAERAVHQTKQWTMKLIHDFLELLFHVSRLTIDTLRTFILIVLPILGPTVFGIAVWDGLAGSLTAWFSRYISVYLWLPVSSILTVLLTKIQVLMVQKDIDTLSDPNYLPDLGTWYYIVFFFIGIVGYFCVPTVTGWTIEAGGSIGSYGHNVNQTAQRGAQGAYTSGKAVMVGAGAAVGNVGGRIKETLLKGKQKSSSYA